MNTENEPPKKLEIRKYSNRRYYDSTQSRHLTLEEIRRLVEQGYDIRVVDAKTKTDITGQVLMQIILELDTVKLDSLPVPLLVHLIRVNDQLIKNFVENYLYKALRVFTEYQEQWQAHIRDATTLPGAFPGMAAWTDAMLQPFRAAAGRGGQKPNRDKAHTQGTADDLRATVRQLQEQVARLQQNSRGGTRKRAPLRRKNRKKS